MRDIIPGIGMSDKSVEEVVDKVAAVAPFVSWVHIDMADGTLVPAKTVMDFAKFKTMIEAYPNLSFEAHLMVSQPEKYIKQLVDAGFSRLIAHVECDDPRRFLEDIQYESVEAGLSIDGPTEFEQIEPFLETLDHVLVMTIEAGASGQTFMPETVEKIRVLKTNYPDLPIAVDGGINEQTATVAADAGATRIVATTYIFKDMRNIGLAIESLKGN